VAPIVSPVAGTSFHWQALTPIQRITGERMRESAVNAPQFALSLSADATNLLWLREALLERVTLDAQARLSITAMLVKIVAAVLPHHPRANAEFAGDKLRLHEVANIGVAVGTNEGLVVPVIKDAGRKSLADVTRELAAFQEKAQTLHFTAEDLAGGTFTLSNLGMFGVEQFTAILNPPQSAILAVGAVVKTPVALDDDTVVVRPMMRLTLTVDHRVLDGLQGARFLGALRERIEKPYFLI
jgi:pyruvate dehydrogenase E2 component (dihydrolipoamide acetyltransferase)